LSDHIYEYKQWENVAEIWEDADCAGWRGPGWYFWDETQAYCHGPYESEEIAKQKSDEYGANL